MEQKQHEYNQKRSPEGVLQKIFSDKIRKAHRETSESLFNKVAGLK